MNAKHDEMVAFWRGAGGEGWAAAADLLDKEIRVFGDAAMTALAPAQGERIVDVGCGTGPTTLRLATLVGAGGHVVGVDVSPPNLEAARRRAASEAVSNVSFVEADVQDSVPVEGFDAVFSRFGVMFFGSPDRAFANLRRAASPTARLAFACWRTPEENPWALAPLLALLGLPGLELPAPPGPEDPGPFSLADPERVRRVLSGGGWGSVELESCIDELVLPTEEEVEFRVQFSMRQGPAARALASADDRVRAEAAGRIREALEAYRSDGAIRLQRSAWIVTATA